MSDAVTNSMIANFAVLEQLVINLAHLMSRDFDDERGMRSGLVDDVRFRMEKMQRTPNREVQRLAFLALEHLDRLEPRILGENGDELLQ
ncbi:hypothetical protein [Neorhizobium sp. DAR64861/K0K2]|uniref:hypothetical protein n=1 Tax=unclassified Neorhizobium TaxID=2629175 RepID=UPI003D2C8670